VFVYFFTKIVYFFEWIAKKPEYFGTKLLFLTTTYPQIAAVDQSQAGERALHVAQKQIRWRAGRKIKDLHTQHESESSHLASTPFT